jgi:hypothetical protein
MLSIADESSIDVPCSIQNQQSQMLKSAEHIFFSVRLLATDSNIGYEPMIIINDVPISRTFSKEDSIAHRSSRRR